MIAQVFVSPPTIRSRPRWPLISPESRRLTIYISVNIDAYVFLPQYSYLYNDHRKIHMWSLVSMLDKGQVLIRKKKQETPTKTGNRTKCFENGKMYKNYTRTICHVTPNEQNEILFVLHHLKIICTTRYDTILYMIPPKRGSDL